MKVLPVLQLQHVGVLLIIKLIAVMIVVVNGQLARDVVVNNGVNIGD